MFVQHNDETIAQEHCPADEDVRVSDGWFTHFLKRNAIPLRWKAKASQRPQVNFVSQMKNSMKKLCGNKTVRLINHGQNYFTLCAWKQDIMHNANVAKEL